jgi:glycosyltransferase involved in cell wall biosynthesis
MGKNPLVSIIIPTYNRSGIICETINNIFQQTYSNFELIIVDDGSTDDTQSKLQGYGGRIRIITQANAGPAIARNRGAEAAHGEIIAFQDSDDLWKPTKIERQVALLERLGPAIPCCLANVLMRITDGKEFTSFDHSMIRFPQNEGLWVNVGEVLATTFVLFNQAAAIWRKVFEKVGGFDNSLKYLEDYDLPMRLALEGPWAFIRDPLVIYRENSPESFHERAMKEPMLLKECELLICERLLAQVKAQVPQAGVRKNLARRLRRVRWQMQSMKLRNTSSSLTRTMGSLLMHADHYFFALARRSPWYPAPATQPVAAWAPDRATTNALESKPR